MTQIKLPESVEAVFPLSPTQQGMLYHSLHSAGGGVYLGQHSLELNNVDGRCLDEAWEAVVNRHSGLRSLFAWRGLSKSVQVIHKVVDTTIARVSLPAEEIAPWLAADAVDDFDLTQSPPSRTFLITPDTQSDPDNLRSIFVWTRHHLLVDGWSAHLVLSDLQDAYSAFVKGDQWLPQPAPKFASYIAWLQKSDLEKSRSHWSGVLSGLEPRQELEAIKTPLIDSVGSARTERTLSLEVTQQLQESRLHDGLTLSTLVHGAWAAVLANVAKQGDQQHLLFGSTIAGRPVDLPESQAIVGNFINTIPVVADLAAGNTVSSWLQGIQVQIAESSLHGHVAKRDMLAAAGLAPATPLFSSVVVFMNYPKAGALEGELAITAASYDEHSHYSLALLVEPGERLQLILIHDLAEIDTQMADYLLDQVVKKLTALPNTFQLSVDDFLQVGNHSTPRLASSDLTEPVTDVVSALLKTTQEFPTRNALSIHNQTMSYAQLRHVVGALAERLQNMGVGAGSNVVIVMPRSLEGLAAIWAVLWLNGTYVPLATGSPSARIKEVVESCAAEVLISDSAYDGLGVRHLHIDSIEEFQAETGSDAKTIGGDAERVPPNGLPEMQNIAYRIHTSGSTGEAKSVAVNHSHLGHSVAARLQYYGHTAYRFALFSPLAFDSSVAGIYWTAVTGGELVLVPDDVIQNPVATADYLLEHQVNALLTLPAVYTALLASASQEFLDSLQLVIVAGEACPADLLSAHKKSAKNATLVNEYGPTEATVWCTAKKYTPGMNSEYATSSLPIGQPIPGARCQVVNTDGEPCAEGVVGELIVDGPIVAMPNRPSGEYATGDLVQALPNGDLLFRGRKDQQVKVRGHRVEAVAVEAGVLSHPAVEACAVVAQRSPPSINTVALNKALNRLATAQALELLQEVESNDA